ncbi:MAG: COG2426 family protein [bacterium JZ-2024 1]
MSPLWQIMLMSLAPVVENRGAILIASTLGISPVSAFFVATLANLLAIPLYYFALYSAFDRVIKVAWVARYIKKRREKLQGFLDRYGWLGLVIFVAIPLPGTGWYTGGLVAAAIGFSLPAGIVGLSLGCIGAGFIALLPSLGIHFAFF